jgi:hypothetical protein
VVPGVSRNKQGYARCQQKRFGRTIYLRHVLAWIDAHGTLPPPDKPCILHTCDNPPCENSEHLWAGTRADNNADARAKGRYNNGRAQRARCPRNHEFTPENTRIRVDGARECRACRRITNKARKEAARGC